MASGIGKRLRTATAKCTVSSNSENKHIGIQLATVNPAVSGKEKIMHSVISIAAVPKQSCSYVRCPSCHSIVQKVQQCVSRMTWDRYRCKCGYDGPLEYIASIGKRRLIGA